MTIIFELWGDLFNKRGLLKQGVRLAKFPFDRKQREIKYLENNCMLLSATVPDGRSIHGDDLLIMCAESENYVPVSFVGARQSLPSIGSREVQKDACYLLHGHKKGRQKICLVHGTFFETVPVEELMRGTMAQLLDDALAETDIPEETREKMKGAFSNPEILQKFSNIETGASVRIKIDALVEVKPEANILDPDQYPEILDDTINLICAFHSQDEKEELIEKMEFVLGMEQFSKLKILQIKHPFNGPFLVFQSRL